jgi:hypothetical protein
MPLRAGVLVLLLTGSFLPFAVSPASAGVLAVSTFDSGTEGWTAVTLDAAGNANPSSVSFASGLGNAGGALRHNAPSESRTSYFSAPSGFINALHGAVGGSFSWDLSTIIQPSDIFFSETDIEIRAGASRLRRNVTPPSPPVSPTYVRNTLTFGTGAGWLFFDGANTSPASQDQINAVIGGADTLLIRAEYYNSFTPDTSLLDNPTIVGPGLGVVLNRSVAIAGDFVEMRTVGSLPGQVVDLYVVVALPQSLSSSLGCGGSIPLVFISNGGSGQTLSCASNPPNTFPRYTGGTTVSAGTLFGVQWPGAAPSGTYIFAAVATPPGALADGVLGPADISTIASAVLTVP